MAYPDDPGELVVSLQDRTAGTAAPAGHLALGALVGADLAVFELPEGFSVGEDAQLEVLLAPTTPERDTVVERIKPLRLWVASLEPAEQAQVAMAPLAQRSRYAGPPSAVDADALRLALESDGDIWPALQSLGVVTRPLRDVDPSGALSRIDRVEAVQRRILVATVLRRDPRTIANCVFSDNCQPPKPTRRG